MLFKLREGFKKDVHAFAYAFNVFRGFFSAIGLNVFIYTSSLGVSIVFYNYGCITTVADIFIARYRPILQSFSVDYINLY